MNEFALALCSVGIAGSIAFLWFDRNEPIDDDETKIMRATASVIIYCCVATLAINS